MADFEGTIKLEDDFTRTTTRKFKVTAVDYATALTAWNSFVVDYAAFTRLGVLWDKLATVNIGTPVIDTGANLDAGMTIQVSIVGQPGKTASIKIPAPQAAAINSDGTLNLGNALTTTLEANYTSGFVLVSDGEVVEDFIKGKLDR